MVTVAEQPRAGALRPGELALSWLDHDLMPRLLVGPQLDIFWENAAARTALARNNDVECRSGKLALIDRAKQGDFQSFILDSGGSSSSWCLPRADGDGHLVFTSQCIDWGGGGTYAVTFFSSGDGFKARYADLRTAFRLTNSEAKALNELLKGKDAEQIARCAGLSIETVRTHIRNIYGKLHVNSREGLFHRVGPYRIL